MDDYLIANNAHVTLSGRGNNDLSIDRCPHDLTQRCIELENCSKAVGKRWLYSYLSAWRSYLSSAWCMESLRGSALTPRSTTVQ
jgi:hypothetical protein